MFVAFKDCGLWFGTVAQFFADTFVNQYVGVDCHTQSQCHGGDARQGQGGAEERQCGDQQQDVGDQRNHGKHTHQAVVNYHEQGDGGKTPQGGIHAFFDVFRTEGGTNGALFDDFHRRGQRTGTQQQGNIFSFGERHAAGNNRFAARNRFVDLRCGDDFGFTLVD